jgi:hypothetical protein
MFAERLEISTDRPTYFACDKSTGRFRAASLLIGHKRFFRGGSNVKSKERNGEAERSYGKLAYKQLSFGFLSAAGAQQIPDTIVSCSVPRRVKILCQEGYTMSRKV